MRYLGAAIGFCVITAAFWTATVMVLGALVMAHCVLSDAQIDAGETCTQLADLFFWPTLIVAVLSFVGIQWLFVRWALCRRTER
ncbi:MULTISPECIES: YccF domain-containing protein [Brevundimonas]|uniref:YccF domain-containing protein n=1 Tax=Brevundimonas TaxID=41275 RepID=UPI0013CF2277|nr:YccF domain-containing protein [Brevundimonas lutea]